LAECGFCEPCISALWGAPGWGQIRLHRKNPRIREANR